MKNLLFALLVIAPTLCFTQTKELKKAIKTGATRGYYTATFKKVYSRSEIEGWLRRNNYVIRDVKKGHLQRFGDMEKAITSVTFMSKSDYAALQSRKATQAKQRQREVVNIDKGDLVLAGATAAFLYLVYEGGKYVMKSIAESSVDYPSQSNQANRVTFKMGEWKTTSLLNTSEDKYKRVRFYCNERYMNEGKIFYTRGNSKPYSTIHGFLTSRFRTETEALNDLLKVKRCP